MTAAPSAQLNIGTLFGRSPHFRLPLSIVTATIAILARKGRGKTYTAAVLAEELLEAGQVPVIIDPTGAHWGLKSSADGQKPGYPVVVFGGEHGDLPLEEHAGETIARAVVEQRFPAILDLSLLRKGASHRFLAAFLETLYRLNREPVHLLADEADDYAPQKTFGDDARVLGAMEDIVRRGRIRGIGCTMITQRPAVLNKNVLTQADMLVALGMNHPKDVGAIEEWIAVHGDLKQAEKMIDSLPSLPIGVAWFWAPALDDLFEQVKIRTRRTFDSSATPKPGEKVAAPKQLAEIDVAKLGKEIADTVQRAKENDPKELKKEIADLKRQLAAKPASAPAAAAIEINVVDKDTAQQIAAIDSKVIDLCARADSFHREACDLTRAANEILVRVRKFPQPGAKRPIPASGARPTFAVPARAPAPLPCSAPAGGSGSPEVGNGGLRRMLIAIAQRPGMDNRKLGLRAGMSSRSGTFATYLAKARTNGWIEDRGGFQITDAGVAALGTYEPLPVGSELQRHWLNELGSGSGVARILAALCQHYPDALSQDALGEKVGMSSRSGTFATYLSKLRGLELIEGRGELRASAELFD
jgi:hypothetical protein